MAIKRGVHCDPDGCLHINSFTIQKVGFVFVFSNCIEDRLAQHCWAGDNLRMKNIPIPINLNSHYNCGFDARGHYHTWTNDVSFVDEQLLRDSPRNLKLKGLALAGIFLRLPRQADAKNCREKNKTRRNLHGKRF